MSSIPSLFISHGSPMLALGQGATAAFWRQLGHSLPKPKAIVVASAHWLSNGLQVSTSEAPTTIHDFYGFPAELFTLQYPAPGHAKLAEQVAQMLETAGFGAVLRDPKRGLDHGAWVPLRQIYPAADIPVLQLSIQPRQSPTHHWRIGQALADLRELDVLLLGSGSLTHNLHALDFDAAEGEVTQAEAQQFQLWMAEQLAAGNLPALLDYRQLAPGALASHPSDEHLLPLFVAMGAAQKASRLHADFNEGALAMDVYRFD